MPFITIGGARLFYEDRGEGFPILFGHSYLWSSKMWEPQVEELSRTYRCIVPDLWGHGRSDPLPARPCSIETLAADHRALVNALGIEQFALIGLSVGGMWGTRLALDHPGSVRALVLMDTFVGPEPPEPQKQYLGMLDHVEHAAAIPPRLAETILPLFFSPATFENNPRLVEEFRDSLLAIPPARIPTVVALGRAIFTRQSMLERLCELSMPALMIVGRDDRSRPPHESRAMAEALHGARVDIVPGAGHISSLEQPEVVTTILKTFLRESL